MFDNSRIRDIVTRRTDSGLSATEAPTDDEERDRSVSRRSVLQTAGTASGVGLLSAGATATGPSQYIVGTSSPAAKGAAKRQAAAVSTELDFGSIGSAVAGQFSPNAIDALRNRADVRYVEADGQVEPLAETTPWGVDRIDADLAHDDGLTGDGADVAIIDSGIDSDHPDLQANLGTGYAVETCSGCNEPWDDDNGHGTHCAGIADALDNTDGVVGTSTESTLHAVKVIGDDGYASVSGLAEGIEWTADQGYDVGSMSLGASDSYSTLQDACQYAEEKGVLLVGAAGNDGCSGCVRYPAAYSSVVAVSATDSYDSLASFSSYGNEVELAAPGVYIYSAIPGGYNEKSGTSMACPHVSGVAGLVMAHGHTNTEARQILQDTAEDIGLSSDKQGHGLVDAEAAADAATGSTNSSPTCSFVSPADGDTISGTATVQVDAGDNEDDGTTLNVDVAIDGGNWLDATYNSTSGNYEYDWDTTAVGDGDHTTESRATDSDGATTNSATITVSVDNVENSFAVSTDGASNVVDSTATLNGSLDDLGGAASADCVFEWRETGTDTWNTTATQTLSSTGTYSEDLSGLAEDVDYEYRGVADASDGDADTGTTVSFTTTNEPPAVTTDGASSVTDSSATLAGSLDDLGGADSTDCSFEYRESGTSTWAASTADTLSATGSFSQEVSGLSTGTKYEFRAVGDASDGDADTGTTVSFTTDGGSNAPAVDSYTVTEAGSPNPHAEITADWAVSDTDGDLDTVLVEVLDGSGSVVESAWTAVGGSSDSGTDQFKLKHAGGQTFDVQLTVTDAAGNGAAETRTVSE